MSSAETNTTHTVAVERTARPNSRRFVLLVVIPILFGLVSLVAYLLGGRYVETDNAYVKADKVPLSVEVAGKVHEVLVHDNQQVEAGQILFRLDQAPFRVALAKAEAKLARARTDFAAMKAGYREKQAEIALAKTRYAFAQSDQRRQAELVERHFVSAAALDAAQQACDVASQQILTLEKDLKRIAESLGGDIDQPVEQDPGYRLAQAELEQARLDLSRTEVRASMPGIVSKPPEPGQYLSAGTTAMALVGNGKLWIEANIPETELTYVHPGQPVGIHIDTYPDARWQGVVDSLSPATGAEFSVIPAQNATGNWVKIAQRVPVRIALTPPPGAPQLRAGLSATVEIDTDHHRSLLGLSL